MEYQFYLLHVKHSSIEQENAEQEKAEGDIPKMYLKVQNLIEFDTFTATHGPGTYVDGEPSTVLHTEHRLTIDIIAECSLGKRRFSSFDFGCSGPPAKYQKTIYPAYFIPELAHVVAMCDEKLPFVALAQELTKRKIAHSGLQVEANATSLVLKLLTLPQPILQAIPPKSTSTPAVADTQKVSRSPFILISPES